MSFRKNLERIAEIYGGIAIFSVDDGSITHRAGVRSGDVLVEVNGRRVKKLVEYAAARKLRKDLLELVVMRDGRKHRLWAGQQASAENEQTLNQDDDSLTCPWRGAA
ncbi:MAG: PDZ domain-containing protein [Polyangiales bacterium]